MKKITRFLPACSAPFRASDTFAATFHCIVAYAQPNIKHPQTDSEHESPDNRVQNAVVGEPNQQLVLPFSL